MDTNSGGGVHKAGGVHLVAIPGSLRSSSSTHAIIGEVAGMFGPDISFSVYTGLAKLPHFDDNPEPPQEVVELRATIRRADGILLCMPEYAFGVPGSLKNALDWTVSSGEFVDKPVALITAATSGEKAHAAMLLTLKALSAQTSADTSLLIPFVRAKLDAAGKIKDPVTYENLKQLAIAFQDKVLQQKLGL